MLKWNVRCPSCGYGIQWHRLSDSFACLACGTPLVSDAKRASFIAKILVFISLIVLVPFSYTIGWFISGKQDYTSYGWYVLGALACVIYRVMFAVNCTVRLVDGT